MPTGRSESTASQGGKKIMKAIQIHCDLTLSFLILLWGDYTIGNDPTVIHKKFIIFLATTSTANNAFIIV